LCIFWAQFTDIIIVLVAHLGTCIMELNKFLVLIVFFVNVPILSMQPMDSAVIGKVSRTYLSKIPKTSSRFAPYPSPKRIKAIKTLAKLNESFSAYCKKTSLRTLGRKPSDEEKIAAAALDLLLDCDPLMI